MNRRIYLDHHATTPVDPEVLESMLPFFREDFGNAASRTHGYGARAEAAVDRAAEQLAAAIGAKARELVWTSGATESINLALKGLVEAAPARGLLVTSNAEHPATLDTAAFLEAPRAWRVVRLPVDRCGRIAPEQVDEALSAPDPATISVPGTGGAWHRLVSLLHASNEVGSIQPVADIGRSCKARGAIFHVDAAQTLGKLPIDVEAMGIDLLSMSAHKLYGPKGVGALWVRGRRPKVELAAQVHGGGHQRGLRSGTLNVPGIVGFGAAAELALARMEEDAARLRKLRDLLHAELAARVPGLRLNGDPERRLPGNLNLSFPGAGAEALMLRVPEVAVSSGSACTSSKQEPSHVLRALGIPEDLIASSIRFGLGRGTTEDEIRYAASRFAEEAAFLRAMSPA